MSYETITITREGKVATLTLNRPAALNAITRQMVRELIAAYREIELDDEIRVLVITGAGRAYCAGFDMKEIMLNPAKTLEQRKRLTDNERLMLRGLWELTKPVIARVHGPAVGGGLPLALMADFVIASEEARFGEPEILFGVGPGIYLAYLLNQRRAKELILLGEIIDARKALELELINQVVPLAELDATVAALAARLVKISPIAMTHVKQGLRKVYEAQGFIESKEYAYELFNLGRMAPDPNRDEFTRRVQTEGVKAAIEWRESLRENE